MKVGVIGAGALGLTAALRLQEAGHQVTVFEREPEVGGLAGSFEVADGIWLEKFYHHIFRTDRYAIDLIREVGLESRLEWHRPSTTVLRDGRILTLDSPASVLRFGPLSPLQRVRLGAGLALLRAMPRPVGLHDVPAGRWMRRVFGSEVHRVVWEPLLQGKFGGHANHVAMAWLWARIHSRTQELGYLSGGFHQLYAALAKRLEQGAARLVTGASVEYVGSVDRSVHVRFSTATDGPTEARFDRVISTVATPLTVAIVPSMPSAYAERYPMPKALGAHCLILALERPLTDVYWIGVNDPGYPFLAVVEHTNLVSASQYGGYHLAYLGNYREHDDSIFQMSQSEMIAEYTPALRRLNPDFNSAWIRKSWIFAAPFAQPVVSPGFARTIPPFDTPVGRLHVANMFQVYPFDRGQNYSIALAERVVRHVVAAEARDPA